MKTCVVRLALALPALLWCGATFAQVPTDTNVVVPDVWESVSTTAPDASDFAARCTGMPPAEFQEIMKLVVANKIITSRASDLLKPYLMINPKRVVCVKSSAKGFPVLPIEVFRDTVWFDGISSEQEKGLWTHISNQLSLHGAAVALVKNSSGNAVQVTFLFTSKTPSQIYYQASFLRSTEFDESKYPAVFSAPGNMKMTSRGNPGESYKFIHSGN